jgi:hypothetical protein
MRRIKAGLSSSSTSSKDKDRLLLTCVNGLQTAIKIIKGVAGPAGVAVPGLQAGLSGLLFILDVVKVECCSLLPHVSPNIR